MNFRGSMQKIISHHLIHTHQSHEKNVIISSGSRQKIRRHIIQEEKRMLCCAHKMQLHTANNFIVETWLVLYNFITSFAMVSCHFMGRFLRRFEGEKNGKQATLNSSNYMRIILYKTQVAYRAHLLWKLCRGIMYHALANDNISRWILCLLHSFL